MKEFQVQLDITFSGTVYVDAESELEAIQKVQEKQFVASDLRSFHCISKSILEVEE